MGLFLDTLSFAGKVAWEGSKLAIEYTPKVIVTLAQTKKELVEFIEDEIDEYKKLQEEEIQNRRIEALKIINLLENKKNFK
jgi:hypothetical protein